MTESSKRTRRAALDQNWRRTQLGLNQFVDVITPWLLDLGAWIFGALTAFNLVILGVVLTIGPVDLAVKIATAAFALALPANVSGFVLLRLVDDMRKIRLRDTASKAFQDAGFVLEDAPPADRKKVERHFSSITLAYTYSLMAVAILLTVTGLTAALWHSGWWIGAAFVAGLTVCGVVMVGAVSQLGGGQERWRSPAATREHEPKKPD